MRTSGVLMHISSLPGRFGIGTFGNNAYDFVDFLKEGLQTYWQVLPLGPTSYGDSPYQSFSTFAGNPYFIDPDILCEQGYLSKDECKDACPGSSEVDYGKLYIQRNKLFRKIAERFYENLPDDFAWFCEENSFWLEDYALFMALKDHFNGAPFFEWDNDIKFREHGALERYRHELYADVDRYKMLQYLFYNQWWALKEYANKNGVKIIGDIPIYVALDSSDVWANRAQFALEEDLTPTEVAGCPPDAFSDDGQLWGNPLYNWEHMEREGYNWWATRLRHSLVLHDVVRIDHFRGFDSYYCIPFGDKNAINGFWREGPGIGFFNEIRQKLGDLPLIAEDLGYLTDGVRELLWRSGFPGMKVIQFAFESEDSEYLPHNHVKNSVVYTGTHDNDTIMGWINSESPRCIDFAKKYLRATSDKDLLKAMISAAFGSVADTCIITMQDVVGLCSKGRMNIPSTVGGNWSWRANAEDISQKNAEELKNLTKLYSRINHA